MTENNIHEYKYEYDVDNGKVSEITVKLWKKPDYETCLISIETETNRKVFSYEYELLWKDAISDERSGLFFKEGAALAWFNRLTKLMCEEFKTEIINFFPVKWVTEKKEREEHQNE